MVSCIVRGSTGTTVARVASIFAFPRPSIPARLPGQGRHPRQEPPPERRYNEAEKGEQDVTLTAESASVNWDTKKKIWMTSIKVGAEVIRRWSDKSMPQNAADDLLRAWVVQTTKDEGYEMAPERVRIER